MGILNTTPDSFYDGGRLKNDSDVLNQVEKMLTEGSTFIDVGGYSSRPNADHITDTEELRRITPVIELILKEFPETLVSIDTFRSSVAKLAIETGACMVNDISAGLLDDTMLTTVANLKVPYIMMHMRGTPKTMQQHSNYSNLFKDVLHYFSERIATARDLGIIDLIVDPGFGFAKTLEQNFQMLNQLEVFRMLDIPILAGLSRKSMIYKSLNVSPNEALNGTTALNMIALHKGASILRVHDVKEAVECIKLTRQLSL